MSEMYSIYNDHNIRHSSSLWLYLVDVKQLGEDASVRNERCGSHPFRCGFYTAYTRACVCRRGGHYHQLFYNVNLLFNLLFHYKKERFHFGLTKVCSTNQSNILQFSLWMQTHVSLLGISSNQFQSNSDLFGSATRLKIYSNYPMCQNLINISEKHMYITCRSLSAQEFTLQVRHHKGSYLYEYLVSLCRNWEASLDYEYSKSVPKPEALLSLLLKSPTSFLQQSYSGPGG